MYEDEEQIMYWNSVKGTELSIPFTKVCIFDGGNTFCAYLQKKTITGDSVVLDWHIATPEGYGNCTPTHWMKVLDPTKNKK